MNHVIASDDIEKAPLMTTVDIKDAQEDHTPAVKKNQYAITAAKSQSRTNRRRTLRIFLTKCMGLSFVVLVLHAYNNLYPRFLNLDGEKSTLHGPLGDGCPHPRRSFEQHEKFTSINGDYDLLDDLTLTTLTGSINVDVYPKSGCGPQTLHLSAQTGSIQIRIAPDWLSEQQDELFQNAHREPYYVDTATATTTTNTATAHEDDLTSNDDFFQTTTSFPKRPINIHITTNTGSIHSSILYLLPGATIYLSATTGSIESTTIYTHTTTQPDLHSHLHTFTTTGHQQLDLLPFTSSPSSSSSSSKQKQNTNTNSKRITHLSALHESKSSGSINLNYPNTWFGTIRARTIGTGTVEVHGDKLQFSRKSRNEAVASRSCSSSSLFSNACQLHSETGNNGGNDNDAYGIHGGTSMHCTSPDITSELEEKEDDGDEQQVIEVVAYGTGDVNFDC